MSKEQSTTRRPRWLRYSTRGLLVIVLLICVLLGIYVWLLQDLREQQAVEAQLNALDFYVGWGGEWEEWDEDIGIMSYRESPTPVLLIGLLGGDPSATITEIGPGAYRNADQLRSALDIVDDLPDVHTILIGGRSSAPPRDRLEGFRAVDGVIVLRISRVEVTREAMREFGRMTELRHLSLYDADIPDDAFEELGDLKENLEFLTLLRTSVTSDCLPAIGKFAAVRKLVFKQSNIGDKNLECLQNLPHLIEINLGESKITSAALPKLAKIPSLQTLKLYGNNITDANLEALQQLPELGYLDLDRTNITDVALPKLAKLSSLHTLSLNKTSITGKGLSHFANIPGLHLGLRDTLIDDDCVDELLQCQQLKSLDIEGSNITNDGWHRLTEGLPNTKVLSRYSP